MQAHPSQFTRWRRSNVVLCALVGWLAALDCVPEILRRAAGGRKKC